MSSSAEGEDADEEISSHLSDIIARANAAHPVVGCAAAIWRAGRIGEAAIGKAHLGRSNGVRPDTVFSIYSVGKVFTASLAMEAIAAGRLSLDQRVVSLRPLFSLNGPGYDEITIRHLLTHSSGIPGDVLTDTGDGDDCIELYVDLLRDLPPFHTPGEIVSYCNAGFVVLGSVLEHIYDRPFDDILADRLLRPLGMPTSRAPSAEDAVTHLFNAETGACTPAPNAGYGRALGPAGGSLAFTARELLLFARMHFDNFTPFGWRPADMRALNASLPSGLAAKGFGLGWMAPNYSAPNVVGHDGASRVFLRLLPDQKTAIAIMTNGGLSARFAERVIEDTLRNIIGAPVSPPALDAINVASPQTYAGVYDNLGLRMEISVEAGDNIARTLGVPGVTSDQPASNWRKMVPIGQHLFALDDARGDRIAITFKDGRPKFLHTGLRALALT